MHFLRYGYILVHIVTLIRGQTYTEMGDLLEHLFNPTRYKRFLRPLENQTQMIKVNFTQYVKSIEHFDISTGEVIVTGFFVVSWKDEFLTWKPHLYGRKKIIQLPKEKFWKPEFELINGQANEESSIYSNGASLAWVTHNGNVTMTHGGTYLTRCNIDTTFFPLDIHHCSFRYIVSNHGAEEVTVQLPTGNIDTNGIRDNGEWYVENTNAAVILIKEGKIENVSLNMIESSFTLRRRPIFSIINTYAPLALMTSLNIAACFVRPDSGERLSFAVTLYLSLVFATTAVIEKIPDNSLKMPYMSYGVLMVNLINTIGVIWSIFIVQLANVKKINRKKIPNFILKMVKKRRIKQANFMDKIECNTEPRCTFEAVKMEEEGVNEENNGKEIQTSESVNSNEITGHEVAEVVDIVYFWLVIFSIFILNSLYAIIVATQWMLS